MENQKSKVKILIVEDEILLAQDISQRLTNINYHVVGITSRVSDALLFIKNNHTYLKCWME